MSSDLVTTIYAGLALGGVQNKSEMRPNEAWLAGILRDTNNSAGVTVNTDTALGYAPVWACLNKIAGHCGYLPVTIYQKDRNDPRLRTEASKHAAYWLLTYPNDYMTGQTFRETLTWHALMGNGRALIVRNQRGEPAELLPLPPKSTATVLVKYENDKATDGSTLNAAVEGSSKWEKWHGVTIDGRRTWFPDRDVLHIPGLAYDGIVGYSVIDVAKQSLGVGMAAEKATAHNFKNGARPSFLLKAPAGTFRKPEEAKTFIDEFNDHHSGAENDGRVGLLREGIDVALTQQTPRDAEWMEQRRFQRQEVALWFAVERILGDNSTVSYNSLEETNRAYVTNCLMRWLAKWEAELANKLLTSQQRNTESHYFKFTTAALLRGTTKDRFEVYNQAVASEIMSSNECRALEDLPPREGGDVYRNPNINPTEPTQKTSQTTAEPTTNRQSNALQSVIANSLLRIIKVEIERVNKAAQKPAGFLAWVDDFYSDNEFGGRLIAAWKECGALTDDARAYIESRKEELLNASGNAKPETLAAYIAGITSEWSQRATSEAERIAKELV